MKQPPNSNKKKEELLKIIDGLTPRELVIFRNTARLPKAQREASEERRQRLDLRRVYQKLRNINSPHVFHGKNWKTHVPFKEQQT